MEGEEADVKKKNKRWDHPLFDTVELARSLADETLLLSETQRTTGKDDEVFSALAMVVRGSILDMEIGTASWHAASQGSLLWFALPPGHDLPFEAWQNFEKWILKELHRKIYNTEAAKQMKDKHVSDPLNQEEDDPTAADELNRVNIFGVDSHPNREYVDDLLNKMKVCHQHEGDLVAFPENWRWWAIALEDTVLISRRAGIGDTQLRKLRDRVLDHAEHTRTEEDAQKMSRDLGLLQKIEEVLYPEKNSFHVKTLKAKATALAASGNMVEAANAYKAAMMIDPTNLDTLHNLATSILATPENEQRVMQAESLLRKVVLRQPNNGEACNALAGLMLEISTNKDAQQQQQQQQRRPGQEEVQRLQEDGRPSNRVIEVVQRRHRREAVRFARQALASIDEHAEVDEKEQRTHGRWHITAAKAILHLQHGDAPTFNDVKRKELVANAYLCKGIQLNPTKLSNDEEWDWKKIRKRIGLNQYECKHDEFDSASELEGGEL